MTKEQELLMQIREGIKCLGDAVIAALSSGGSFALTTLDPPVDAPEAGGAVVLFNVTTGIIYIWDGTIWTAFTNGSINDYGLTSASPPVDPPGLYDPKVLVNLTGQTLYYWRESSNAWFSLGLYSVVDNAAYSSNWDFYPVTAPSKNAVYDEIQKNKVDQIGIVIDGGASVITTGQKGFVRVPYAATVTGWTIMETSDTPITGSIVVDIWKDTYANYPPTVGDSVAGSEKPTLSSAIKNQDLSLTTWGTGKNIALGDIIGFNVEATPANVKRVIVLLHVLRT